MQRKTFIASGAAAGASLATPRFTLAAGTGATVKIGFLESFSGVFSDLGAMHKIGALLALEDANRSGRDKFEFVYGDDASKPAVATTEFRRLVTQENVDVVFGGTSSGSALAITPLANELGVFNLVLGAQDSSITGDHAGKLTYRFGPNVRMLLNPVLRRTLALGKKWYFLQADYALGKDAYAQCSEALRRAGGTEAGHDVVPLGTADFSAELTKVRNSGADVLVLCNSGLDAANTIKQFVAFGLHKTVKLSGISLEDIYYKTIPLDAVVGATFPVLWAPFVSPSAAKLAARMRKSISGPLSGRHYLGYMAAASLIARLRGAGTTKAESVAAAFANAKFDGGKSSPSEYRGCDHQCVQDSYAGSSVSTKAFAKNQFMYDIVGEVPASESNGSCEAPWAKAATAKIAADTVGTRAGYTAKSV